MASDTKPAKVKYYGYNFLINPSIVKDRNGKIQYLGIGRVESAKMIRQFVKFKYGKNPDLKVWVTGESYSGGSSIRVYMSTLNGSSVSETTFNEIEEFSSSLRAGSFNGQDDSYNYKKNEVSELGTELSFYTSYIFCYNQPSYGSPQHKLYLENQKLDLK